MREIFLAKSAGFCFGVQRAVETALTNNNSEKKIYTLGPLIHNNDVVSKLEEENVFSINLDDADHLSENETIIIRSHGIPKATFNLLESKNLHIIDATCPYVTNIHKKVEKYYNLGYGIIIVGDKDHPEVIGINGWCNNTGIITKDGSELIEKSDLPENVCLVSQTTEKQMNFQKVLAVVKSNCKEVIAFNTICSATETRQKSADELSKNVDVMIVIGGKHSSNTNKLYEICKSNCKNTFLVENSREIPDNIINSRKYNKIGITAGASTPDWVIKEAIEKMSNNEELTMHDVMQFMDENHVQIKVGDKIKGKVVSRNENGIYLNINYKADAFLPKTEILGDEDSLNENDEVDVKVISRKNEEGYVVVSTLELEREKISKDLKEAFDNAQTIKVKIIEVVKGGVIALYKDVARLFLPASQIELFHVDDLSTYINKVIEVAIIEYEKRKGLSKIVVSRRQLLKKAKDLKEEEVFSKLQKGSVVEGEVKRISSFGAFIEIDGIDGLLHISEISWGKINHPSDVLKIGDKIEVMIIEIDKDSKKLSLSIKQTLENPWNNVEDKYPVGNIVLGKVVRFVNFGAFVELEPGVDGLVHISQISEKRISKADEALTIGQEVKAKILLVDPNKKRIELSLKEVDFMM
ncbi:MAG: bifunctional 4-hydroxy-3-methylbut-2-enyl diphosphate reductase/30S ribosomal protein S1 [Clostridiaceae bacterium]